MWLVKIYSLVLQSEFRMILLNLVIIDLMSLFSHIFCHSDDDETLKKNLTLNYF